MRRAARFVFGVAARSRRSADHTAVLLRTLRSIIRAIACALTVDITEEKISEPEETAIEIMQDARVHMHTHTQDQGVKTERQRELWNDFKHTKIHVPGVPKEEGRTEKIAEELLPKDFPNLMKTLNPQVQKLN